MVLCVAGLDSQSSWDHKKQLPELRAFTSGNGKKGKGANTTIVGIGHCKVTLTKTMNVDSYKTVYRTLQWFANGVMEHRVQRVCVCETVNGK